jgi:hypothetical protein
LPRAQVAGDPLGWRPAPGNKIVEKFCRHLLLDAQAWSFNARPAIRAPFEIDDLELLAGRPAVDRAEWQAERQEARQYLAEHYPPIYSPGQSGHCQLDLSRLFELGMDGLILELKTRRITAEGHTAEVYQSFLDALEGLGKMIENAAESADEAARRSNPERSVELDKMAALCGELPTCPRQPSGKPCS